MPTLEKFIIRNFKGIERTEISINERIDCPVITLIGLNESGKTTILEALSHFVSGDRSVSALFGSTNLKNSVELIPVNRKAAFNSTIDVSAKVQLDSNDISKIEKIALEQEVEVDVSALQKPFFVTKEYSFEESEFKGQMNRFSFKLLSRPIKKKGKPAAFKPLGPPESGGPRNLWSAVVALINASLPQVAYFPTFLVDMPNRIYLKEYEGERATNRYYRFVFQDILSSQNDGLSLDRHVCKRIDDFREGKDQSSWLTAFWNSSHKTTIDSVFQKISSAVTREVLGSWHNVFQRTISAKNIFVEWGIDSEKGNLPYASFHISDGESRYAISERSLGFRWFFSFLLFTAFKQAAKRPTIFLFDEPAANLHAKAQAELLKSFSRIASGGNRIIYSTHSHHMINPQWLSGAYIVENTALDYEIDDSFGIVSKPTDIVATKYREFINKHSSRSSYFQPVVEKLEYVSPEIIGKAPFVIVEGISDYYALRLCRMRSSKKFDFCLMPGVGSGASGPLVSQMLGRGERFLILLDDDKAGQKEAERYQTTWFLPKNATPTLGDVSPTFAKMRLEELLGKETESLVQAALESASAPTKKQIGLYLAEACANGDLALNAIAPETQTRLEQVLDFLQSQLKAEKKQDAA